MVASNSKKRYRKKADLDSTVRSTQEGESLSTVMIPGDDLAGPPFSTIIKPLKRPINLTASLQGPARRARWLPGDFIPQFTGFGSIPGWCINVSTFFDLPISYLFGVFCFFSFPCAPFFRTEFASAAPSLGFSSSWNLAWKISFPNFSLSFLL